MTMQQMHGLFQNKTDDSQQQ